MTRVESWNQLHSELAKEGLTLEPRFSKSYDEPKIVGAVIRIDEAHAVKFSKIADNGVTFKSLVERLGEYQERDAQIEVTAKNFVEATLDDVAGRDTGIQSIVKERVYEILTTVGDFQELHERLAEQGFELANKKENGKKIKNGARLFFNGGTESLKLSEVGISYKKLVDRLGGEWQSRPKGVKIANKPVVLLESEPVDGIVQMQDVVLGIVVESAEQQSGRTATKGVDNSESILGREQKEELYPTMLEVVSSFDDSLREQLQSVGKKNDVRSAVDWDTSLSTGELSSLEESDDELRNIDDHFRSEPVKGAPVLPMEEPKCVAWHESKRKGLLSKLLESRQRLGDVLYDMAVEGNGESKAFVCAVEKECLGRNDHKGHKITLDSVYSSVKEIVEIIFKYVKAKFDELRWEQAVVSEPSEVAQVKDSDKEPECIAFRWELHTDEFSKKVGDRVYELYEQSGEGFKAFYVELEKRVSDAGLKLSDSLTGAVRKFIDGLWHDVDETIAQSLPEPEFVVWKKQREYDSHDDKLDCIGDVMYDEYCDYKKEYGDTKARLLFLKYEIYCGEHGLKQDIKYIPEDYPHFEDLMIEAKAKAMMEIESQLLEFPVKVQEVSAGGSTKGKSDAIHGKQRIQAKSSDEQEKFNSAPDIPEGTLVRFTPYDERHRVLEGRYGGFNFDTNFARLTTEFGYSGFYLHEGEIHIMDEEERKKFLSYEQERKKALLNQPPKDVQPNNGQKVDVQKKRKRKYQGRKDAQSR